jgi:hypothetical protein
MQQIKDVIETIKGILGLLLASAAGIVGIAIYAAVSLFIAALPFVLAIWLYMEFVR